MDAELKLAFEKFGKATNAMRYAHGGHLLACSNATTIEVIDPVRLTLLHTLYGHKGIVRHLCWTPGNLFLVSSGNCGGVYFWRGDFKRYGYEQGKEEVEPHAVAQDKAIYYAQVAYDAEFDALIGLTSHEHLRVLVGNAHSLVFEQSLRDMKPTCFAFSKELGCLVVASSLGFLVVFNWPLAPVAELNGCYQIHLEGSVTSLCFTSCDK